MTHQDKKELLETSAHIQDDIANNEELASELEHCVRFIQDAEEALSIVMREFPGKVVARSWIRSKQAMLHEAMEDLSHYIHTLESLNRINDGTLQQLAAEVAKQEQNDVTEAKGE